MLVNKKNLLETILVVILFLYPFIFYKNLFISGPEVYSIYNSKIILIKSLFTWDSSFGFGLYNNVATLFYNIIYFILDIFFTPIYVQNIILGSLGAFSYIFYKKYIFLIKKFLNVKENFYADILAALLYIFNPFYLYMSNWFPTYQLLFFIAALNSYFIFNNYNKKNNFYYYKLVLISLLSSYIGINIGLFAILVLVIIINLFLLFLKSFSKETIRFSLIYLFIFVFSNLFWLLPFTLNITQNTGNTNVYFSEENINLRERPIFDSITLHSFIFSDKTDFLNRPFFDFSGWYKSSSQLIFLIIFLLVIYFTFNILEKNKKNKLLISYLLIIIFVSIFFSKGMDEPLADLFRFFINNFKLFAIFRSIDIKIPFIFIFFFPILLSISFKNRYIIFISFIFTIFLGFPLISGKAISKKYLVSLPNDINYLQNISSNKRILLLPKTYNVFEFYTWGYEGVWLSTQLGDFSSISYLTSTYGKSLYEKNFLLINEIYDELLNEYNSSKMDNLFKKYAITGLLMRKNISLNKSYFYSKNSDLNQCIDYNFENELITNNITNYINNKNLNIVSENSDFIYYDFKNNFVFESKDFDLLLNIKNNIFIISKKDCDNCSFKINQNYDGNWLLLPLSMKTKCIKSKTISNNEYQVEINIQDSCSDRLIFIYWPEIVYLFLLLIIPLEILIIYYINYKK